MISGVIVTRNSQNELGECLESIKGLVDEIVVVDLQSDDQTVDIAKSHGAKVHIHTPVNYVELVRQESINLASGEWVIVLDPDEKVTPKLRSKLLEVAQKDELDAINIPRKNIFFSKWVRHTNFWPDRQIRFFKKANIKWSTRIHSYPQVSGQIHDLPALEDLAIEHRGYATYADFFDRQNRYSSVEADNLHAKGEKFSVGNLVWRPMREILVRYIKHAGFLDGFLGVSLVYSLVIYQIMVQIKLWEKTKS